MNFVLFGHSFVRRLRNKRSFVMTIKLERAQVPITCLGEGGLTLDRIRARPEAYFRQIKKAQPSILILDLGTNDLSSKDVEPAELCTSLRDLVYELVAWDISPSIVVFLPVLPRTGNMRRNQVSVAQFNKKAEVFNQLLGDMTFLEDGWFVWKHRGLRHPRYNTDGVHLNERGMVQYERTLKQLVKFFEARFW